MLYRNIQTFGVPAVFGRTTLYPYEIKAMTLTNNIISAFESRESSKDWVKWESVNVKATEVLAWAGEQFRAQEDTWQNEYR